MSTWYPGFRMLIPLPCYRASSTGTGRLCLVRLPATTSSQRVAIEKTRQMTLVTLMTMVTMKSRVIAVGASDADDDDDDEIESDRSRQAHDGGDADDGEIESDRARSGSESDDDTACDANDAKLANFAKMSVCD
jgi:hypothetical protein